ncbi:MAG: single-stranded DNA-binding protein [Cellulosilyticum sp.]|nr:single-stranded DNA-binding protein [Cellulosilyticum sp.]
MNKVILMGRLVKDPEIRYSKSETPIAIAQYILAVRKNYVRENEADAEFINIVAFGKNADFVAKYFSKGSRIIVEGKLHQDAWEDAEHKRHWKYEVIVEHQYFAEGHNKRNDIEIQSDEEIQSIEGEIAAGEAKM